MISVNIKLSHAFLKEIGVFFSPTPNTKISDSRSQDASFVKSLSLEINAKASNLSEYNKPIASMIIEASVADFPVVYANW